MIRAAIEQDFANLPINECTTRILGLKNAYGLSVSFLRFYADGEGSIASVIDGFCVFHSPARPTEEWLTFLRIVPDVQCIHTNEITCELIVKSFGLSAEKGLVMRLEKAQGSVIALETPQLQQLYYTLLQDVFSAVIPPFEGWYVDISHRVRHGVCHIAVKQVDGRPVSCAMTVAETDTAALVGYVATKASYRGRGYASDCINTLLRALPQSTVYISPNSMQAKTIYEKCGFSADAQWMEIRLD